jgi:hypothetical protein
MMKKMVAMLLAGVLTLSGCVMAFADEAEKVEETAEAAVEETAEESEDDLGALLEELFNSEEGQELKASIDSALGELEQEVTKFVDEGGLDQLMDDLGINVEEILGSIDFESILADEEVQAFFNSLLADKEGMTEFFTELLAEKDLTDILAKLEGIGGPVASLLETLKGEDGQYDAAKFADLGEAIAATDPEAETLELNGVTITPEDLEAAANSLAGELEAEETEEAPAEEAEAAA